MSEGQSALEYMMTYGWAILIIVIVAAVLYSFGVFSPSSSTSNTVTGFGGFSIQVACIQGGALVLQILNGQGYTINITRINSTGSDGQAVSIPTALIITTGQTQLAFVPDACTTTTGVSYSNQVTITYTEPGQVFPGPYFSEGKATGIAISTKPNVVGNFNGVNSIINTSTVPTTAISSVTITGWVYLPSTSEAGAFITIGVTNGICGSNGGYALGVGVNNQFSSGHDGNNLIGLYECVHWLGTAQFGSTGWYFVAMIINSTSGVNYYINSNYDLGYGDYTPQSPATGWVELGGWTWSSISSYFTGKLSDFQVYNSVLSGSQITALYNEGLGGGPVSNSNLVGWWPLDGNANDYSGNGNNGVATNVSWVAP